MSSSSMIQYNECRPPLAYLHKEPATIQAVDYRRLLAESYAEAAESVAVGRATFDQLAAQFSKELDCSFEQRGRLQCFSILCPV